MPKKQITFIEYVKQINLQKKFQCYDKDKTKILKENFIAETNFINVLICIKFLKKNY